MNGQPCGILGYFNIDSVFFHGGRLHITYFIGLHGSGSPWMGEYISDFGNIEVTKDRYGRTHIITTGGIKAANDEGIAKFVADAWERPDGLWAIQYSADYDNVQDYFDIAITNNYVLVDGTILRGTRNELFYNMYNRNTATDNSIFGLPLLLEDTTISTNQYFIPDTVFSPYMNPLIKRMAVDSFVLACYDTSLMGGAYVVSFYENPISNPVCRSYFSHPLNIFQWIAFNEQSEAICMTEHWNRDEIYMLNPPYNQVYYVRANGGYRWWGVDRIKGTDKFTVCGFGSTATECIWDFDPDLDGKCIKAKYMQTTALPRAQESRTVNQYIVGFVFEWEDTPVEVRRTVMHSICK